MDVTQGQSYTSTVEPTAKHIHAIIVPVVLKMEDTIAAVRFVLIHDISLCRR